MRGVCQVGQRRWTQVYHTTVTSFWSVVIVIQGKPRQDWVRKFLDYAQCDRPSSYDFEEFREYLLEKSLSRSTINNYSFAIQRYYRMHGESISFKFIRPNNNIPYYLEEDDIFRIFSSCRNLKHFAMLHVLFYACLRASELCNLER
jgi:integrase